MAQTPVTSANLRTSSARTVKADAVVIGIHADPSDGSKSARAALGAADVAAAFGKGFATMLKEIGASTSVGDTCKIPSAGSVKAPLVVTVGLGPEPTGELDLEVLRRAAGAAARATAGKKSVVLALPAATDDQIRAVVEGALLGNYGFDRYLSKKHEPVGEFVVISEMARSRTARKALADGVAVAEAVNFARDLINVPPNDLYPESFAREVKDRAKGTKISVTITDEKALESKGYGGIMGVGKGSIRPPRLVKLSYKPSKPVAHIALVGKGITFDSGGLSIKGRDAMMSMKRDMTGAGVVLAVMGALTELDCPVRVTGLLPLAENSVGASSIRPGDVLRHYGGRTSEVTNTDAEGRLVLADAMAYAVAEVKPDVLVDVATLTGAIKLSLGQRTGGLFANDDRLAALLRTASLAAGEPLWRMPLVADYEERISSKIADADNAGGAPGAITAALFLQHFTGGVPWAHLDIASVGDAPQDEFEYTKGATGFGARAFLHWLEQPDPLAGVRR
jgi:leucyl aminopeptidase